MIETYNLTKYDSKTSGSNNNTATGSEQVIKKQMKTTALLNIRSNASTSSSIVGNLAKNTMFKAVAQKKGTSVNGNNTWYRIEGKGWVSGAYVTESSSSLSNKNYYTVRSGDTLWSISQQFQISINQLLKQNNLSSSLIFVGQRLLVSK